MSPVSRPIRSKLVHSLLNLKKSTKMNLCHVSIPKVVQKDNNMLNCIHQLSLIQALKMKRATVNLHLGGMTVRRVRY